MRKGNNNDEIVFKTKCENAHLKKEIDSSTLEPDCDLDVQVLLFDNLVSVKTVAEMLGVAPKTIHNWVYLRKIPYVKCGQKVMFRPKSLKAWLNRKEKPCL